MTRRRTRNRTAFGLESLEIRNAPSHFGVVAHAAAAVHALHAAAHVRHVRDSEVNPQTELKESSNSIDSSQDGSKDPSTPNDSSSVDPKSDR